MTPRYAVEKVIAAATSGDLDLVGSRARDIVLTYVDGFADAFSFASALVAGLRLEHFQETVTLDEPYKGDFDVYICPITAELIKVRPGARHPLVREAQVDRTRERRLRARRLDAPA